MATNNIFSKYLQEKNIYIYIICIYTHTHTHTRYIKLVFCKEM